MYAIAFDTPLMGRQTELHDTAESASTAVRVALRRFSNVTVNGTPVEGSK